MTGARTARLACAMVVAACGERAQSSRTRDSSAAAPTVAFSIDLWPGEGVPVFEAQRPTLMLRTAPGADGDIVDSLRGDAGRRVDWDSTVVRTIEPGVIRVMTSVRVSGRDFGPIVHLSRPRYYDRSLPVVDTVMTSPASMDYLQDRAEGACFVRIAGRAIEADPCPAFATDSVSVDRRPVSEWWIRARGQGAMPGWIMVSDSTVRSVRRVF